ncbi:hypothetical protein EVAR_30489_1 [Eumeta japonica]|uniref:Uncharacterized protein n=1 Tax=Eumeta variegata TaxID=151549 RepID=A0A4C1W0R8_EUMVA|nr:hypothetical protein EVAR_30489_1 [Eumeta japonica]
MDNDIVDVCKLVKDRQLDILCVNEIKRKGSGGIIKHGSFETYCSSVDQSQRRCICPDMFKPLEEMKEFLADALTSAQSAQCPYIMLVKCDQNERIVILDDLNGMHTAGLIEKS